MPLPWLRDPHPEFAAPPQTRWFCAGVPWPLGRRLYAGATCRLQARSRLPPVPARVAGLGGERRLSLGGPASGGPSPAPGPYLVRGSGSLGPAPFLPSLLARQPLPHPDHSWGRPSPSAVATPSLPLLQPPLPALLPFAVPWDLSAWGSKRLVCGKSPGVRVGARWADPTPAGRESVRRAAGGRVWGCAIPRLQV